MTDPKPKEVHDLSPPHELPPGHTLVTPETKVMCSADTWRALGFDPVNDPYDRDILITVEMSTRPKMSYKRIAETLLVNRKTVARRIRTFNARMRKALAPFMRGTDEEKPA